MDEREWSAAETYRQAGISRQALYTVINGTYKSTDTKTLDALAKVFKVTADQLRTPHPTAVSAHPLVESFLSSPYRKDLDPTEDEIEWLQALDGLVLDGRNATVFTVAELLQWHRRKK